MCERNDPMDNRQEEEQLLSLLREICNRLSVKLNSVYAPYGLTAIQFEILTELYMEKQLTMSALAQRLAMSNSNCSAIVKRLEQHEFVCRTRDPMDQRIVHVCLCDHAKEMLEQMRKKTCPDQQLLLQITKEDHDDILKGLYKLNTILKECDSHE